MTVQYQYQRGDLINLSSIFSNLFWTHHFETCQSVPLLISLQIFLWFIRQSEQRINVLWVELDYEQRSFQTMTDTPNDTLPPTTFEVTNPSSSQATGATATNSCSTRLLDNDNDSSSAQPPLPGWYLTSSNYLLTLSWLIWVLHLGHTTSVSATFVEYMCYAVISINNFLDFL